MIRSHLNRSGPRRGNILIVTLLLLALFATIGLTIVYYTKDLSEQSRIINEAASNGGLTFPDDGSVAFNQFLSQLIYDSTTPAAGTMNSAWGHSLMRTMYGGAGGGPYPAIATVAWNGVGTFHEQVAGMDRALYVNLSALNGAVLPEISTSGAFVPMNAPYTYPDIKDFYLASFVPATGEVLVPSFYRPVTWRNNSQLAINPYATGLEPPGMVGGNPNWLNTNRHYKALIARPRPIDNGGATNSAFPYVPPNADGTYTGDVQNLVGSGIYYPLTSKSPFAGQFVAHNDSIWIDIGLAPMTLLNGKTVKPLVAPLIIDLDSLMNYSVHGNQMMATPVTPATNPPSYIYSHTSGAGIGPWEINLSKALSTISSGQTVPDGQFLVQTRGNPMTLAWNALNGTSPQYKPYNTRSYYNTAQKAYGWVYSQGSSLSGQSIEQGYQVPWSGVGGASYGSLNQLGNGYYGTVPTYSPAYFADKTTPLPNGTPMRPGYDSTNTTVKNHPALWNPAEWGSALPNSQSTFPVSDIQSLFSQYGNTPFSYGPTTGSPPGLLNLGGLTPMNSIRGQAGTPTAPGLFPFPFSNAYDTPSNYMMDPALMNRMLITPYSFSLDRPGLSPNFKHLTTGNALSWGGSSFTGGVFTGPTDTNAAYPAPTTNTGTLSDNADRTHESNARAALGPVDLNRPLADYRPDPTSALSPINMMGTGNYTAPPYVVPFGTSNTMVPQAVIDRQLLAMAIFVRLVVASGADASYQVVAGVGETISFPNGQPGPNTPAFHALRALAQIAANIVDYIDNDDVSTAFVWNPATPADPLNPTNFANPSLSVVYGVEKPRLVLTEAFSEITNNPDDPALRKQAKPATASESPYVRFWFELQNPTGALNSTALTDGSVWVRYPTGSNQLPTQQTPGYSPYFVQIVRSTPVQGNGGGNVNVSDVLRDPANVNNSANVTGAIVGTTADLNWDFSAGDTQAKTNPFIYNVSPPVSGNPNTPKSFMVCAPQNINLHGAASTNFQPTFQPGVPVITGTAPNNLATTFTSLTRSNVVSLTNALNGNTLRTDFNQNVILLRRLANPYLPPNDPLITTGPYAYSLQARPYNPYITIDYMDYVPTTDQIYLAQGSTLANPRTQQISTNPHTLGKVQPYASWTPTNGQLQSGNGGTGTYNFQFPTSMVLPQQATTQGQGLQVKHTFGYVNSMTPTMPPSVNQPVGTYTPSTAMTAATLKYNNKPETLMTPYFWLPHLDRTLLNQSELLQVSTGKPHELTLRFLMPNAQVNATDIQLNPQQTGPQFANTFAAAMGLNDPAIGGVPPVTNTLYRALDVLRIQPYGQMTALNGRVPGRLNINTIQDKRVWDALFDVQSSTNAFSQTDVNTLWNTFIIGSRTKNAGPRYSTVSYPAMQLMDASGAGYNTPVPGASVYDNANAAIGTDRPFLPFGAPTYAAGGGGTYAFPQGSGLYLDTLLRNGGKGSTTIPTLFNIATLSTANPAQNPPFNPPGTHPYQQAEMLRKIMNNTTTVSHTFAVWVTVGYFDYNYTQKGNNPFAADLGAEYYSVVPGDLRRKYFGVVDRSLVSNLTLNQNQPPNPPFFTTIDAVNAPANSNTIAITTSSAVSNGSVTVGSSTIQGGTGMQIAIGSGATQEVVTVTAVGQYPPAPPSGPQPTALTGVAQLTLSTKLQYPHYQGESVSNIIPGNPGPQPNFNYTQAPYSYVVPFTVRLQ